jgi:catechol 2,3-dioxygenase-like lactoylglutathione lyase family enzyme
MKKELQEVARFTSNPKRTIEFYKSFLGLEPVWETEHAAEFKVGAVKVLVHKLSSSEGSPGEDHLAFTVDDVDSACAELEAKGLRIEKPARTYEWGTSAYLRDPDGRWLELYQKKGTSNP